MNIPIWLAIVAPPVFGSIGFLLCAMFTAGKVADAQGEAALWEAMWQQDYANPRLDASAAIEQSRDLHAAHARCADSRNTLLARIDRALACETPKAAHGVRKMARLLRGEEA